MIYAQITPAQSGTGFCLTVASNYIRYFDTLEDAISFVRHRDITLKEYIGCPMLVQATFEN